MLRDKHVSKRASTSTTGCSYDVVWDEVQTRFKGPGPHQNRARTRGVLGLSAKQFEEASALREAFDTAEAAKPAKPAPRRPVTRAEFDKIKSDAVANGFMDLYEIGKAWGMKWAKTLEHMHYLDPTVKDTVQLIQGGIEKMDIPQAERRGLYKDEFDRLTADRQATQGQTSEADRQARTAGKSSPRPNAWRPRSSATRRPRSTPSRNGTTS